jgi:hypothetical protein
VLLVFSLVQNSVSVGFKGGTLHAQPAQPTRPHLPQETWQECWEHCKTSSTWQKRETRMPWTYIYIVQETTRNVGKCYNFYWNYITVH